jgi:hypothetical protein
MAWIELHQAVWTHRKTFAMADLLDIRETYAAAHVMRLWTWALDNAPDGCLPNSPRIIARSADWDGSPDQFIEALVDAGWVDRVDDSYHLHDWADYAGRLIDRRVANTERMRTARANRASYIKEERVAHIPRTFDARAGATVPNRTQHNPTQPDHEGEAALAASPPPRRPPAKKADRETQAPNHAPIYEAFTAIGLSPGTLRSDGKEQRAASALIRAGVPASDLAECWADIRANRYGNDYERRTLSFHLLQDKNFIGNWQTWRDDGKPAARTSGNTPLPIGGTEGHHTSDFRRAMDEAQRAVQVGTARWEGAHATA